MCTRVSLRWAILLLVVATLAGCTTTNVVAKHEDAYHCVVEENTLNTAIHFEAEGLRLHGAASRTSTVEVDPITGARLYTATVIHRAGAGPGAGLGFGSKTERWLGPFAPHLDAYVVGQAGIGFEYERGVRNEAEEILKDHVPRSGWNKMIFVLGAEAAGSATAGLENVLNAGIQVDAAPRAYLTLYDTGGFSIARSWSGSVQTGAQRWILDRLGDHNIPTGWTGRISATYEWRFGPDQQLQRLTTVAETQWGNELRRTTRLLDVTTRENLKVVRRALPDPTSDLFHGFSAGKVFFLNPHSRLWPRLTDGIVATVVYKVSTHDFGLGLNIGPYGIGYSHEEIGRQLVSATVRGPAGARTIVCSGSPDLVVPNNVPEPEPVQADRMPSPQPQATATANQPSGSPPTTSPNGPSGTPTVTATEPPLSVTPSGSSPTIPTGPAAPGPPGILDLPALAEI